MAASTEMSSRQLAKGTDVSYLFLSQVKKVNRPMPDNLKVKLEYLNDCDSIHCRYENGDNICLTSTRPGVRIPSPSTIFCGPRTPLLFSDSSVLRGIYYWPIYSQIKLSW